MLFLNYTTDAGSTESLAIDATASESHSGEMDVTEHPVETGANITDHARKKPRTVKIDGVLVDYPVENPDDGNAGRALANLATLEALRDNGQLVELRSQVLTLSNLLIQAISYTRTKDIADAVRFSATLREVRLVDSQTVAIKTAVTSAKPKHSDGKKTGEPAKEAEVKKSWAKQGKALLDQLGALKKIGVQ